MAYELEETGDMTRTAHVSVPFEQYNKEMNRALNELAENADMDGFRKGNVPMSVIKRKYGQRVQGDVIENLVRDQIDQFIEDLDQDILHLGQPEVTQVPGEDEGSLDFDVYVEISPAVDPVGYMGLEVDSPQPEVDDEEIDEQLEQMREQFATLEPIEFRETIEEGDVATIDFKPLDDEDVNPEEFSGEDMQVEIGAGQTLPGIEEALEGAGFSDTVEATIELPESFPEESLQGKSITLQLTIKSVKTRVLPELNDEFAKDTGEAETMLELRGQIREQIADQKSDRARHVAEDELVDALVDAHDIDVPPKFLDQQLEREVEQRKKMFQQQGLDIDDLEIDIDDLKADMEGEVKKSIKSEFILLAIAEKEGLEVGEEDLNAFFEHQAQHNPQINAEQLRNYAEQDPQQMQSVQYQALMEKTKSLLMDEAEVNEISWSEFEEKQRQNTPAPAGLDEDSSDAGLDEDSSDVGLDEDSSDVGLDEDSSEVEED